MSRVSSDDSGAGYTDQLVLCLMLILCVSISLGAYIAVSYTHLTLPTKRIV